MKKQKVNSKFLRRVAWSIGLSGNAGLMTICTKYCKKHSLPLPQSRQDARDILIKYYKSGSLCKVPDDTKQKNTVINPNSDAFLQSYEWRRVRMQVLKRDGARCVCCGATPADGIKVHVDHIKPRRLFPHLALDQSNLQVLCEVCNHGKGNWDHTDWREKGAVVELEEWQKEHLKSV